MGVYSVSYDFRITMPAESPFPGFDVRVKRTVTTSWVFMDAVEYTWSCLPGYLLISEGSVRKVEYESKGCYSLECLDHNNKTYIYLYEAKVFNVDMEIGNTGVGWVYYGGWKVADILKKTADQKGNNVAKGDWQIVNIC